MKGNVIVNEAAVKPQNSSVTFKREGAVLHEQTARRAKRYLKLAVKTSTEDDSYNGLRIHALPGLHDFIAARVMEYFEPGVQLLDMAAGTGAMSLRMQHLGFKVTATDYFPESFKLDSVPFTQADLNDHFSSAFPQRFRAIIASEIIEHLENPWHFARECFKLLEPGGRMLLSTPNIENAGSKASFIRSGTFLWFNEDDYSCYGHICPLTQWQIHQVFREAGFQVRWKGSFGEGSSLLHGSPRLSLLARFIALISLMKANLGREVFVAVMEKPLD